MAYSVQTAQAPKSNWSYAAETQGIWGKPRTFDGIAIHHWDDPNVVVKNKTQVDNIVNHFMNPNLAVSPHYVLGLQDSQIKIVNMVPEADAAWCTNSGNPMTVAIEIDSRCELGGSDADKIYDALGWLIANIRTRHACPNLWPHNKFANTSCPGIIDFGRINVAIAANGGQEPSPAPVPQPVPIPQPASGLVLHLPASAPTWRVYPLDKTPVPGNEVGFLRPSLFNGLDYNILTVPQTNVATIQTRDYGKVNIWTAPDTGATITGQATGGAPEPVQQSSGKTLYLPATATAWRVYPLDIAPVGGNESGYLSPSLFGGLTYAILGNPQTNVVTIQTRDYGKVNIWVAPDTGAIIR